MKINSTFLFPLEFVIQIKTNKGFACIIKRILH